MIQKLVLNSINVSESILIDQIISLNEVFGEYESYIPGNEMNQLVWHIEHMQTTITYIDDFIIDLSYFLIDSVDIDELETTINKIKTKLALLDLKQISNYINQKDLTTQEYIFYIKCLAITLSESSHYNPIYFDVFCKALKHTEEAIRYHTVFALSYLDWLEFIPFLEQLLPNESHPDVKSAIQRLIEGHKKFLI